MPTVLYDHSITQILTIIVNFAECGIQYTSIPKRFYEEVCIPAKKPTTARFTGLFGATATGHKFKPLIVGISDIPISANWPAHYDYTTTGRMTEDVYR